MLSSVFFVIVWTTEAAGQDPPTAEEEPSVEILEKGKKAPWTGILMTVEAAAKLEADLQSKDEIIQVCWKTVEDERSLFEKTMDEQSALWEERMRAAWATVEEITNKPVPTPQVIIETEWWEPLMWVAIGVAGGAGVIGGIWLGTAL